MKKIVLVFILVFILTGCGNKIEKVNKTLEETGELSVKIDSKDNEVAKEDDSELIPLNKYYSKDKNTVYYLKKELEGSEPDTFEVFKEGYAKDKNTVYLYGEKKEEMDAKTFVMLPPHYAKDKNNAYYLGIKIEADVDTDTFDYVREGKDENYSTDYSKDKNNVYYKHNKILEGADPASFECVGNFFYAKDKNSVYYAGSKIEGSDPLTFEIFGGNGVAKDKDNCYSSGIKTNMAKCEEIKSR